LNINRTFKSHSRGLELPEIFLLLHNCLTSGISTHYHELNNLICSKNFDDENQLSSSCPPMFTSQFLIIYSNLTFFLTTALHIIVDFSLSCKITSLALFRLHQMHEMQTIVTDVWYLFVTWLNSTSLCGGHSVQPMPNHSGLFVFFCIRIIMLY